MLRDELNLEEELPENEEYLRKQLVTYIGNKRKLLGFIGAVVEKLRIDRGGRRLAALDAFSGSGAVARLLKRHAQVLHVNDLEPYARLVARAHLANRADVPQQALRDAIARLNRNRHALREPGIVARLYAPRDDTAIEPGERAFYTSVNARIIDNLRRDIAGEDAVLHDYLLASLVHKASVHANTSGVFKGFYKNSRTGIGQFGGNGREALSRITTEILLEEPLLSRYDSEVLVHGCDANGLVHDLPPVDLAYFDPPYNEHPYGSNYFMLNLVVEYREPTATSRVSGIPSDWRRSVWNGRRTAEGALEALVGDVAADVVLLSYSDEGIIPVSRIEEILARFGDLRVLRKEHAVFRGSRNLDARSKSLDEYLFVLTKRA